VPIIDIGKRGAATIWDCVLRRAQWVSAKKGYHLPQRWVVADGWQRLPLAEASPCLVAVSCSAIGIVTYVQRFDYAVTVWNKGGISFVVASAYNVAVFQMA